MRFDEAVKGLKSEEIEALKTLEACGWQVGLDVRVEDMTKPDGMRRRTFSNRGRYAVAVFLKNLSGRERVEFPAFTPEAEAVAVVQGVEIPVTNPEAVVEAVPPDSIPEPEPVTVVFDEIKPEAKNVKRKGRGR